jgi:hypothetical protein
MAQAAVPLMIIGTGVQMYGQYKADKAQAKAEEENGKFLREQEKLAKKATARELDIFDYESKQLSQNQMSAFARAGVDISGSPLAVMAETRLQQMKERAAIETEGTFNARLARLRSDSSMQAARDIRGTMGLRAGASLLTGGANAAAAWSKS